MCVPAPAFAPLRGATARPVFLGSSMAEHPAVNRRVAGSSPARGAKSILLIGYKPDSYRVYSVGSRVARNFPPRRGSINSSSRHQARKVTHMRLLACLAVIGLMSMGCGGSADRAAQMQTLPGGASASSAMSEVPIDVTDPPALDVKLQVDERRAARRVLSH